MACPLLTCSPSDSCRAVLGRVPLTARLIATYCRGPYGECPAYRFVQATAEPMHPADFRAWVGRRAPRSAAKGRSGRSARGDGAWTREPKRRGAEGPQGG